MGTDRENIIDLFTRLGRVLDDGELDDLRQVYAKDVHVRSPRGADLRGIDTVIDFLRENTDPEQLTQHVHGDILIEVDGDRADTSANQLAYFYRAGQPPHLTAGVRLEYTAVRTDEGWRFQEANIIRRWQTEG